MREAPKANRTLQSASYIYFEHNFQVNQYRSALISFFLVNAFNLFSVYIRYNKMQRY